MKKNNGFRRIFSLFLSIIVFLFCFSSFSFAETIDANVLYEEGMKYLANDGDSQNILKGISLLIVAANEGSGKAMIEVGQMYTNGFGKILSPDYVEGTEADMAYSWYVKAAEAGEVEAAASAMATDAFSYFLGSETVKEDDAVALKFFEKAAEYGDSSAINMMVAFYTYGFGVEQDPDKALQLGASLANKGDQEALYAMEENAYAYYAGTKDGIDINFNTAFQYYIKLAEYGNERAMYNVGLLYEYGLGTSKDRAKAIEWLTKAQDAGYEPATTMLEELSK